MNIRSTIVEKAKSFIGQHEIRGNMGFEDDKFQQLMEAVGWQEKQAWCAYFTELVWKLAYAEFDSTFVNRLDILFSAGAVKTWNNFLYSEFVHLLEPTPGDVVIWQNYRNGKPHWTGHAGIVVATDYNQAHFTTVEGNTNDKGGREGIMVASKSRLIDFEPRQKGLVLKGFIKPMEV